jgi:transglutaminase superfamily protein
MSAAGYFLTSDCYVCRLQDYWIILDAKCDKYLCVAHADLASIGHRLRGWQDSRISSKDGGTECDEEDSLIESLASRGVLTRCTWDGKPFAESEAWARERAIEAIGSEASARSSPLDVIRFFWACGKVHWRLRFGAFSRTVAGLERRRRHAGSTLEYDAARAAQLIAIFKRLRPLFPRPYLCLFDSLALFEFLAGHGCFPHLVFGVVADPFEAHCWLQAGTLVLNDNLERTGRYKPILRV